MMKKKTPTSISSIPLHVFLINLLILTPAALCNDFNRHDFPPTFVFGAGTSAFQYEGAVTEDGRTPSVLDNNPHAGMYPDGSTANVTADGYHKYKEDVKLMSDTGLDAYRFSISWSRLIPYGRGSINAKGVEYYNNVLDELAIRGIQPHVTLNHLDIPLVLQDEYGGWMSPKIVDDFREFADICFREFGDKVLHWTTMNEPNINGMVPEIILNSTRSVAGNSTNRTYIMIHHMLLAHSEVVRLYKANYQHYQGGWIGFNAYSFWCQPLSNSSADVEATRRAEAFMFDWVLNPIVFGDYPELMKKIAGPRLPSFTKSQSEALKASFDFLAMNYYTSVFVSDNSNQSREGISSFQADMAVIMRVEKTDSPAHHPFLPVHVPKDFSGLQKMMQYLKKYGNFPIYIHENGFAMPADSALNDSPRIDYLKGYIGSTLEAIRNGADVKGYFVWSFLDVFEFLGGYNTGFGLYHVDFDDDNRPRTPKLSALWYSDFLKNNTSVAPNIKNPVLGHFSSASQ